MDSQDIYKWTMFMGHVEHKHIDYVLEKLNEYDIRRYIIGMETADSVGEHIHFMVEMADGEYHNFAQNIFKKKFKLRGQNRDGLCKQYGKIKNIRDLERSKRYTVKCKNVRTNMQQKEIDKLIEESFIKEDKKKLVEEVYEHLDKHIKECYFHGDLKIDQYETYDKIKLCIIKYYIEKDLKLSPQYKSMIINWVRQTKNINMPTKLKFLQHIIN